MMMKNKLIHLPPQQLDPNISDALDKLGEKKQFWIVDPVGIDFSKFKEEPVEDIFEDDLKHIGDWDDNKQHTEDII